MLQADVLTSGKGPKNQLAAPSGYRRSSRPTEKAATGSRGEPGGVRQGARHVLSRRIAVARFTARASAGRFGLLQALQNAVERCFPYAPSLCEYLRDLLVFREMIFVSLMLSAPHPRSRHRGTP
jgi:hypothetical protein